MILNIKIMKNAMLIFAFSLAIYSCQKMDHPPLGNYPKDANPPGGPLKFYAAMDGSNVDSIKANFGVDNSVSYVDGGASGMAVQVDGSQNGFVSYPSANDFGASTDFTVSFWMNITLAQKNHENAVGVLAFGNTKDFWGNITVFLEHETSLSDSMPMKIHFNGLNNTDVWDAANYTDNNRWPHMYDGQWHHVAITYHATDSLYTAYRDGVQFDTLTMSHQIVFENASQLVVGGFQQAAGVNGTYAENTWMSGFPGMMDNVRLYGTTLSAADVASLYSNRQ